MEVVVANRVDGERLEKLVKDVVKLHNVVEYVKNQLDLGQAIDPAEIQAVLDDI
jgi:ribosomal protein L7Ae-like RNA K-turn-binding protein